MSIFTYLSISDDKAVVIFEESSLVSVNLLILETNDFSLLSLKNLAMKL